MKKALLLLTAMLIAIALPIAAATPEAQFAANGGTNGAGIIPLTDINGKITKVSKSTDPMRIKPGKPSFSLAAEKGPALKLPAKSVARSASNSQSYVYLVGSMAGWATPDEYNADVYDNWKLYDLSGDGIFTGTFSLSAGEVYFRAYPELTGWGATPYASCEYDNITIQLGTPYEYTEGEGCWLLNSEGKEYTFTLNTNTATMTVSEAKATPDENWKDIGECMFTDPFISQGFFSGVPSLTYKVRVEENVLTPGFFRLVAPYGTAFAEAWDEAFDGGFSLDPENYDANDELYLEIHAEDPDHVYIMPQMLGVNLSAEGPIMGMNFAGLRFNNGANAEPSQFGMLNDGIITLPVKNALIAFPYNDNNAYYANSQRDVNIVEFLDLGWGEWEEFGTASFPETFMNEYIACFESYWSTNDITWDGSFSIMHRYHESDSTKEQFRFDGVFNDVNIIIDYDNTTNAITSRLQDTGLNFNEYPDWSDDCFKNFKFRPSGYYYPGAKCFCFNPYFYATENARLQLSVVNIYLDGAEEFIFKTIPDKKFISSKEPATVNFTVELSSSVSSYRVTVLGHRDQLSVSYTLNNLSLWEPTDSSLVYSDYTADTFTLELPDNGYDTYRVLIAPFGDDHKRIYQWIETDIAVNHHPDMQWTELGKGVMTDYIVHKVLPYEIVCDTITGELILPAQTHDVIIDESADHPGLFRIRNPFGPEHPLYESLTHTAADDDFYMYIDASDPSRVMINYSFIGFGSPYFPYYVASDAYRNKHIFNYSQEDLDNNPWWGKFEDKRITFRNNTVSVGGVLYGYSDGQDYDLELFLPGYEPFTAEWVNEEPDDDNNVALALGNPKITSVAAALIPKGITDSYYYTTLFPEQLYDFVITPGGNNEIKTFEVAANGEAVINISELEDFAVSCWGYNDFRVVAVPLDADGNRHGGIRGAFLTLLNPADQWISLGEGSLEERISLMPFGIDDISFVKCEIQENKTLKGLYRLIAPYAEIADFYNINYTPTDIFIDARDPEQVDFFENDFGNYFTTRELGIFTGLNRNYGIYLNTLGNYLYHVNDEYDGSRCGRMIDDVIEFSGYNIIVKIPYNNYKANFPDAFFRVTLPEKITTGIEDLTDDADAEPEYFNLQGLKVADPSHGIFIERRGSKSIKRVIP